MTQETRHRDGSMAGLTGPATLATGWQYSIPGTYRQNTTRTVNYQTVSVDLTDGYGRTISVTEPVSMDSYGSTLFFAARKGWAGDGSLAWISRRKPSGGVYYEVYQNNAATGTVTSGLSLDTVLDTSADITANATADNTFRKIVRTLEIDSAIPPVTVDGSSVSVAWRKVSTTLPTASGSGWETLAARQRWTALSECPVASWLGHTGGAIPLEYRNEGGTVYAEAIHRTWTGTEQNTQRRVLRNSGQFRKVIARNGLDYAYTSPEAANILMPWTAFREPLAEASWDTIPHWPKLEVNSYTGQVTARLLPNSSLYTAKSTYFSGTGDHRAGRVATSTTWTYQPSSQAMGTTNYHYNARGDLLASYGNGVNPTAYVYDSGGRMTSLRTWQTAPALNPGTIDADLIDAAYSAQTTNWGYGAHSTLPLVRFKTYPGRPNSVFHAYWQDGSLNYRNRERKDGAYPLRTTWLLSDFGQVTATHYGSTSVQSFPSNHALYTIHPLRPAGLRPRRARPPPH